MSYTTLKHRHFVSEPMGMNKDITEVAGIGPAFGAKFCAFGLTKAHYLLGQYLLFSKDDMFLEWLKMTVGMEPHYGQLVANCLGEWCNNFL